MDCFGTYFTHVQTCDLHLTRGVFRWRMARVCLGDVSSGQKYWMNRVFEQQKVFKGIICLSSEPTKIHNQKPIMHHPNQKIYRYRGGPTSRLCMVECCPPPFWGGASGTCEARYLLCAFKSFEFAVFSPLSVRTQTLLGV